jgi:hypothetical protein
MVLGCLRRSRSQGQSHQPSTPIAITTSTPPTLQTLPGYLRWCMNTHVDENTARPPPRSRRDTQYAPREESDVQDETEFGAHPDAIRSGIRRSHPGRDDSTSHSRREVASCFPSQRMPFGIGPARCALPRPSHSSSRCATRSCLRAARQPASYPTRNVACVRAVTRRDAPLGGRADIRLARTMPAAEQGLRVEHEVVGGHDLHRHDRNHGEETGAMRLLIHALRWPA